MVSLSVQGPIFSFHVKEWTDCVAWWLLYPEAWPVKGRWRRRNLMAQAIPHKHSLLSNTASTPADHDTTQKPTPDCSFGFGPFFNSGPRYDLPPVLCPLMVLPQGSGVKWPQGFICMCSSCLMTDLLIHRTSPFPASESPVVVHVKGWREGKELKNKI